ncbi:Hypothetical predicted protein [Mytilus galloprovincialis]|uniref:SGNH hydrolase-type esterase domain-containing protein n=1 Tax=Mytilus galloprovincialis TaxID=29158 RepID=A0A8B6FR71_MYTGA|nr:Hypothetical predicted protein [Mytilus galloprovincialis]
MSLLNSFTAVKTLFNSFNATLLFNGNNEPSDQNSENSENESVSLDLSAEDVPDFLHISPKKNSVTIHVAQHMLQDVQRILDSDLNSVKSHFQFGNIYKTVNNSVTVTLYVSTGTINVQGRSIFTWIDTFVANCESLEKEIISSQPRSSTPVEFIEEIFNSSIESSQENSQMSEEINDQSQNLNFSLDSITNLSKSVNNSKYDGKSKEDLIQIINDLESKLENKCSEVSIQTDSIECQTAKFVNACDVSTQTAPIPAPRLSKLKLHKEPCKTVETTIQPENQIHNLKQVKSNKTQNFEQLSSDKNLIIGSSILKGIRPSGLSKTDIRTFRGANIDRITSEIMKMNLRTYKNIILQVGGNDISAGHSLKELEEDFESLIWAARSCCNKDCNIIVSGLPPRYDVNVYSANLVLEKLCQQFGLVFIRQYEMYMSDSFNQNKGFYTHDGIHFNSRGTSRYIKTINNIVGILNYHSYACANCGELNHKTSSCRFEMKIKCHKCNMYGHKQKFCLA